MNLSIGQDAILRHEKQTVGVRVDVVNLMNSDALYNFLSTFSGTHFVSPRSITGRFDIHFRFFSPDCLDAI